MATENIVDLPGLEKLNQVISEALEIEKCSICLGKAQDTVLLWPCTHWFCSSCISAMHQSAQGQKVKCPLCKSATTRRSILPFHEEHKEYEDKLQRLIGAISLDLGFDITSYKNKTKNGGESDSKVLGKGMLNESSSPVRKAKPSIVKTNRVTRSRNLKKAGNQNVSASVLKPKPVLPPETPPNFDDCREKKVKDWLESSKFSQVETNDHFETVVVDIHKPEVESPGLSEDQLQSVTQVDPKPCVAPFRRRLQDRMRASPSNIEAIIPFDVFENKSESKRLKRNFEKEPVTTATVEVFDQILPQSTKTQLITTTYGRKTPSMMRQKNRIFMVESDLFTNVENPPEMDPPLQTDFTQDSLQDFSSGSGEEWTIPKKKPTDFSTKKKSSFTVKSSKKITKSKQKNKGSKNSVTNNVKRSSARLSKENDSANTRDETASKSNHDFEEKSFIYDQTNHGNSKPIRTKSADIVKEITDDWNESKCTNVSNNTNPLHVKHQLLVSDRYSGTCKNDSIKLSPFKQMNQRSPGWSRLKTTKKEFHMSEKKKLTLKTFGKSKSNPSLTNIKTSLTKQNKSFDGGLKEIVKEYHEPSKIASNKSNNNQEFIEEKINLVPLNNQNIQLDQNVNRCSVVGKDLSKTVDNTNINKSFASDDSTSPCRGFCTPQQEKTGLGALISNVVRDEQPKECNRTNILIDQFQGNASSILKDNKNVSSSDFLTLTKPIEVQEKKLEEIEALNCFTPGNKYTDIQEELSEHRKENKKRERDSGIHVESSFFSPERKRICRDAEVQTSPGHKHSFVKEMIRDIWGVEAEQIFEDKVIGKLGSQKSNSEQFNQTTTKNTTEVIINNDRKENGSFLANRLSQSSDKENINELSGNKNKTDKCFNDSDFIMGTEDNAGFCLQNLLTSDCHSNSYIDQQTKGNSRFEDIDPDAVTQTYKTPIGPRKTITASTNKIYSALSKPTDSELRRIGDDFDKNDVLFSTETFAKSTPWNHSGINKLEDVLDTPNPSQSLKEKPYKSRKQLDFVEEDSKDMFEIENMKPMSERFMKESESKLNGFGDMDVVEEDVSSEEILIHNLETQLNEKKTDNDVDNYPVSFNCSVLSPTAHSKARESPGITSENENVSQNKSQEINKMDSEQENFNKLTRREVESKNEDNIVVADDDEVSNASSEDCMVEGTPDVSQIDMQHEIHPVLEEETEDIKLKANSPLPKKCLEESSSEKRATANRESSSSREQTGISNAGQTQNISKKIEVDSSETVIDSEDLLEEGTKQYCFASSLLNQEQIQMLTFVLNGLNMKYSKTVGNHISHLVVSTTNGCSQNTYKFLYAMALHKPIIRFEWVEEVLRTGGTVPLDPYLARDPSGECGVLRAKKDKSRELLKDFAIHIYNVNDRIIQKGQIEELVRLCGGTVVTSQQKFHQVPRDLFRVILLSEPPDSFTQAEWRQKYSAAEVSVDWIYNTVGRYRVVALTPYMLDPESSAVSFLQHEGYPEDLIFDPPTQQQTASFC